MQRCGAFKLRGVTNNLKSISEAQRRKGVVTASTGNHGIALACAAQFLKTDATVYLCENVPKNKVENIRNYGAKVKFVKGYCLEAQVKAMEDAEKKGKYYVHPYNSPSGPVSSYFQFLQLYQKMSLIEIT